MHFVCFSLGFRVDECVVRLLYAWKWDIEYLLSMLHSPYLLYLPPRHDAGKSFEYLFTNNVMYVAIPYLYIRYKYIHQASVG